MLVCVQSNDYDRFSGQNNPLILTKSLNHDSLIMAIC